MKYLTIKKEEDYFSDGEEEDNATSFWPGQERNDAYLKIKKTREEERKKENVRPTFPVNYRPRPTYMIAPIMGAPDPRFYSSHYIDAGSDSSPLSGLSNLSKLWKTNPQFVV